MKKWTLFICTLCIAFMFTGCATIPEFKSMKEAECYVGTVPVSERFSKEGINTYASIIAMNRRKNESLAREVLGVAVYKVTGLGLLSLGPAPPWSDYKDLSGYVFFSKMPMVVYREKPGEPIWNVSAEALKRAGAPPHSDSCTYEGIRVGPKILGTSSYEGEDGKIVVADGLHIKLYFARIPKADPPCDKKAWQVYTDYIKAVADHAKRIMEEEFALPRRTRFCTIESKDKQ